jgi:hypothetical protein
MFYSGLTWASRRLGSLLLLLVPSQPRCCLFGWGYGGQWEDAFRGYRANLGRGILLGLEFLDAGDIVNHPDG